MFGIFPFGAPYFGQGISEGTVPTSISTQGNIALFGSFVPSVALRASNTTNVSLKGVRTHNVSLKGSVE